MTKRFKRAKFHRPIVQSHRDLANRYSGMERALMQIDKPSDEQKRAMHEFGTLSSYHSIAAMTTGDKFVVLS